MLVAIVGAWTLCKPSCHWLDIIEEGPWTLSSWNDGHCMFVSKDENGSNFSNKPTSLEGTFAGVGFSACGTDAVGWGESNVAHPSFLGTDICGVSLSKVVADCCWGISGKEFKDDNGKVCGGWYTFTDEAGDGADDVAGIWNKSMDEAAEETGSGTRGASKRSKLLEFPETDDRGRVDTLPWKIPAGWSGSETTSVKPPELYDL